MLFRFLSFASLAVLLSAPVFASAPRLPVEDFVRDEDVSQMQLSPDGRYESFLHDASGQPAICCQPVGSTHASIFDLGDDSVYGRFVPRRVYRYMWVSNDRLLVSTAVWNFRYGIFAVNRDGSKFQGISGLETLPYTKGVLVNVTADSLVWADTYFHRFDDEDRSVLMFDRHSYEGKARLFPDVVRMNTLTGTFDVVAKNPGNVIGWADDQAGRIRVGLTARDNLQFGLIRRDGDRGPWQELQFPPALHEPSILEFDADNRHLYVAANETGKPIALYRVDSSHPKAYEFVFRDPEYDFFPERFTPEPQLDGIDLCRLIFSAATHSLVGVRYVREGPKEQWIDPKFQAYQAAIDHAMPTTVNVLASSSADDKRLLFFCSSDREPGTYCLLDAEQKTIHPVGQRMPWIKPADMAQMFPIAYKARDGVVIHGFLTVPVGAKPQHLPLVVMPHGGPWVRDFWQFDPLVQFLANRGYAVLQMNYRGSSGYSADFFAAGRRQIGGKIQDDIEDGTRWTIAKGIADPARIAIVGESFGGYSALFALGHNPGLYRCGVSFAGVTDWVRIFGSLKDDVYQFARAYWVENIGDPATAAAELKEISPVNFADQITAPLLIIQGSQDRIVPPDQAHALVKALKAAGHPPETLFLTDAGHGTGTFKIRRDTFNAIEAFLAKHLGTEGSAMKR